MAFGFKKRKLLHIRTYGDPALKKKAEAVETVDDEILALGQEMIDSMYADDGIGLAGPQVAIDKQMVALGVPNPQTEDGPPLPLSPGEMMLLPRMPMVIINPEIISSSDVKETAEEGCLSVPGIYANVERSASVVVRAQILGGETFTVECGGLLGRAMQHEIDHLNGILFVERLTDEELEKIKAKLERLKKQGKKRGFLKAFK